MSSPEDNTDAIRDSQVHHLEEEIQHMTLGIKRTQPVFSMCDDAKIAYPPHLNFLPNVSFQNNPFYEVIAYLLKPCELREISSLMNPKTNFYVKSSIGFKLRDRQVSILRDCMEWDMDLNTPAVHAQLRIGAFTKISLDNFGEDIVDLVPFGLHVQINGESVRLLVRKGEKDLNKPMSISNHLKLSSNEVNKLVVNWVPLFPKKHFAMQISIVRKKNLDEMISTLKDVPWPIASTKEMIKEIVKVKKTDPTAASKLRVSFHCPFSNVRITCPVRGVNCFHLQCFNAESYIAFNERKSVWACPVCSMFCPFEDLKVDQYFLEIMNSPLVARGAFPKIEIQEDGKWKIEVGIPRKHTVDQLMSVFNIRCMPIDTVKEMIRKKKLVRTRRQKISFRCPLSGKRIMCPVRGRYCTHLQCFNAACYIAYNRYQPFWMCPVCWVSCSSDEMIIDEYFFEILNSPLAPSDGLPEFRIMADASWKLVDSEDPKPIVPEERGPIEFFRKHFGVHIKTLNNADNSAQREFLAVDTAEGENGASSGTR